MSQHNLRRRKTENSLDGANNSGLNVHPVRFSDCKPGRGDKNGYPPPNHRGVLIVRRQYLCSPLTESTRRKLDSEQCHQFGKLAHYCVQRHAYRSIGMRFREHDELVSETICEALSAIESLQLAFPERDITETFQHAISLGYTRVRLRNLRSRKHKQTTLGETVADVFLEENPWTLEDFIDYVSTVRSVSHTMRLRVQYLASFFARGMTRRGARYELSVTGLPMTKTLFLLTEKRLRRLMESFLAEWLD